MNMPIEHTTVDERLAAEALETLRHHTGIQGHLLAMEPEITADYRPDAIAEFSINGQLHRYIVECKRHVDRKSALADLKSLLARDPRPGLLIAPYISRELAEYCRAIDLQFLDIHGNAFLQTPGMYVFIKGEKNMRDRTLPMAAKPVVNASALRVAFVLLCQPGVTQAAYRDIMESAGVSLGAISNTFDDLKRRGLLAGAERGHGRTLLDPKRMVEEWVINYPLVLRPKLNPLRFSAPDPGWWHDLDLDNLHAVWSGEVAAERLTRYLKPEAQTLYVAPEAMKATLNQLVVRYRLRPDPLGAVEIVEKFWRLPADPVHPDVAPPLLVYADLIASFEPRNTEVANMLRETVLETASHPT